MKSEYSIYQIPKSVAKTLLEKYHYLKDHSRGKTKGIEGEWRPRSQKHRFVLVYDKDLNIRWKQIDK